MRSVPTAVATSVATAVACLALAAPASTAHAQFGKLIKRAAAAAGDVAAEAAAGKAAEKAGGTAVGRAAASGTSSSASGSSILEITPERIDAFLVAMRGPIELGRQRAAHAARLAEYEQARQTYGTRTREYERCSGDYASRVRPAITPATQARNERIADQISAMADAAIAAQERGDTARVRAFADSSATLSRAMAANMYPGLAKACGTHPGREPVRPSGEPPRADDPAFRAERPAGMTVAQMGMLHERIGAWLLANDRRYTYAEAERAALEGKRPALAPLTPLFRGEHMAWRNVLEGMGERR